MESGGYQSSALPFGIPMFFGKSGEEWFAFVGGLSGLELQRTRISSVFVPVALRWRRLSRVGDDA
ncbi:unnamed protein product [Brassica oleracea var. botrytis]